MSDLLTPTVAPGQWLRVTYDGPDNAELYIGVAGQTIPAFLDTVDGRQVMAVRCPDVRGRHTVTATTDGLTRRVGQVEVR